MGGTRKKTNEPLRFLEEACVLLVQRCHDNSTPATRASSASIGVQSVIMNPEVSVLCPKARFESLDLLFIRTSL